MTSNTTTSALGMTAFPGEAPASYEIQRWLKLAKQQIPSKFAAAFAKVEPAFMLDYRPFPIEKDLPALQLDLSGGYVVREVEARNVIRANKKFENETKAEKGAYAYPGVSVGFQT